MMAYSMEAYCISLEEHNLREILLGLRSIFIKINIIESHIFLWILLRHGKEGEKGLRYHTRMSKISIARAE